MRAFEIHSTIRHVVTVLCALSLSTLVCLEKDEKTPSRTSSLLLITTHFMTQ
jgi:hypothetical protein